MKHSPLLLLAVALPCVSCRESEAATVTKHGAAAGVVADLPLEAFRGELLDLAFEAASAFPLDPHVKNRSRAQEAVVAACFELDQPRRALAYVEEIDNWRRGAGYADFALYCAEHGHTSEEVQPYLDRALRVVETSEDALAQRWRADRVRATIARTHLVLGNAGEAARFGTGLAESEAGELEALKATIADEDAFDQQLEALGRVLEVGGFDQKHNALIASARLYDRFYADGDRRSLLKEEIQDSWDKLPVQVRIEVMIELVGSALDHGDGNEALALLEEAKSILEGANWLPEDRIPLMAMLAALRHRAGDEEGARTEAAVARSMFEAERNGIVDIWRAGALRPLAEAYHAMGDEESALQIYGRAVEEGVVNPNSRPRAEDLAATCASMAVQGVEPGDGLWARIREARDGLGDPW